MPIPHHRIPTDLSSSSEPVYLGLDVPRAAGLALSAFLTLWSFTWHFSFGRTVFLVLVWGSFITLGFWEVHGLPVWQVVRWASAWARRRLPARHAPAAPRSLFRG